MDADSRCTGRPRYRSPLSLSFFPHASRTLRVQNVPAQDVTSALHTVLPARRLGICLHLVDTIVARLILCIECSRTRT
jgi:hypothetical protein